MRYPVHRFIAALGLLLLSGPAELVGVTYAGKCEAEKVKQAGKYNLCRLRAKAKAIRAGGPPNYARCDSKLTEKWTDAETVGGGMCPTNGDVATIQARITSDADDVAACLDGVCPPSCGDGATNGNESCDGGDLSGASCMSLGFVSGTLACTAGCGFDVSGCTSPPPGSCGDNVKNGTDSCDGADLGEDSCTSLGYTFGGTLACTTGCGFDLSGCLTQAFPATGQTLTFGAGSDGDVEAGAPLSYSDNGDGTVTDTNTGLMWEKKSDDGSVHDKDNTYTWGGAVPFFMNGTMVTSFLALLNDVAGGGVSCFAGYCDWRIPNIKELQSIVNFEADAPAVSPAFNTGCGAACDNTTCSCTRGNLTVDGGPYWSSTTRFPALTVAWYVDFSTGQVSYADKTGPAFVRAVRGGL